MLETARRAPEQSVLNEIAAMHLAAVTVATDEVVPAAERIMRGALSLPGFPSTSISLLFAPEDLNRGLPTFQLMVASLASADILLNAYHMTQREEFYVQARNLIIGFAEYEAGQWIDHGLMWNDHAISARIPVLVKFWALYRAHPDFDPNVGRILLGFASRSAQMLAKPSFYAWRTSHGILSDLAILQVAAAFPEIPGIDDLKKIAEVRFRNHLNYWINEEGVTLLHSAGYHVGSLYHFGLGLRLFTLNGVKIPDEWWQRYTKAIDFYSLLRRSDGTVPMYGDTSSTPSGANILVTSRRNADNAAGPLVQKKVQAPPNGFFVFPVAGHAILWDGQTSAVGVDSNASQSLITWSYHPGLGHKVADELSMILWARGRTWLTNAGYWPYGVWGRDQAESWGASNAPHLLDENKSSERSSQVRSAGQGDGLAFIDVERSGPSDFAVRRQVIRLAGDQIWIVLDHSRDLNSQTVVTNWIFYPDLNITALPLEGGYIVNAPISGVQMLSMFSGSDGFNSKVVIGSKTPFAGWVVQDRTPTPAPTIVNHQTSRGGWSLASFSILDRKNAAVSYDIARMVQWENPENWTILLERSSGNVLLTRAGRQLTVHRASSPKANSVIELTPLIAPEADIAAIRSSFQAAAVTFDKFQELISFRIKVSYILLAILIGQEFLILLTRRRFNRAAKLLRISSWLGWSVGGVWLTSVYFG